MRTDSRLQMLESAARVAFFREKRDTSAVNDASRERVAHWLTLCGTPGETLAVAWDAQGAAESVRKAVERVYG